MILDQVNACVGNVLPLRSITPSPLPPPRAWPLFIDPLNLHSSRIRYPLCLPPARHYCWRTGRSCLRPLVGPAALHLRRPRPHHPPQVSGGLCPDGMDQAALWSRRGHLPQLHDDADLVPVHGVGTVGHRTGGQPPHGTGRPPCHHCGMRHHDHLHLCVLPLISHQNVC